MSTSDVLQMIHELDSYDLIHLVADDDELEAALTELAMCDGGEDGE